MNSAIFEVVFNSWKNGFDDGNNYKIFAEKFGFPSAESLRSSFRRERKSRGLSRDNACEFKSENKPQKPDVRKFKNNAKILLFDLETSPILCMAWGLWQQDINIDAIIQDWHLLSFSAKWLFDDEVISDSLTSEEAVDHNDSRLVKKVWDLLDQADITISHNGDRFDCKRINTRFLFHSLPPVSHYQSVDTLVVAKNTFNFSSNKLDYINRYLGLPEKTDTGFDLWKRAFMGDAKALKDMEIYNRNDVTILEELFIKLRPYIKNVFNLNLWNEENVSVCPNCGCPELVWKGTYHTYVSAYKSFRCSNCGAIGRSKELELDKEKRKVIVR